MDRDDIRAENLRIKRRKLKQLLKPVDELSVRNDREAFEDAVTGVDSWEAYESTERRARRILEDL